MVRPKVVIDQFEKSIEQSNQSHPRRKDNFPFSSNRIRLAGQQVGRIVIRTSCFISANQKPSEHPSDDLQDDIFVSAYQKPSEHPSDDLQDRLFVSANHIFSTDHPSDGLSYRPITSFVRIIFWTDFCLDQSESFREPFARSSS